MLPEQAQLRRTRASELMRSEIERRLNFLQYLALVSGTPISAETVKLLFNVLVYNSVDEPERDLIFAWVTQILRQVQPEQEIFGDESLNYFFYDVLLKLDQRNFSAQMFDCLEQFFLLLNQQYSLMCQ